MEYQLVVEKSLDAVGKLGLYAGEKYVADIGAYLLEHHFIGFFLRLGIFGRDELIVLCRDDDSVDAHRSAVGRVFDCHLAL